MTSAVEHLSDRVAQASRAATSAGRYLASSPTGAPSVMHDDASSPEADSGIARSPARYWRSVRSATPASSAARAGITQAMSMIRTMADAEALHSVRFEDARLRTWFGTRGREALQGAGSIKRDCSIWQEFLQGLVGVPFLPVSPQAKGRKLDSAAFKRLTGWQGRTSEHGRDAAMLVWGV